MDGLSQKQLIEWLDTFELSPAQIDSQHIDTIALTYPKDQWADIAFDLYETALSYIHKKGYLFCAFLVFYLNNKKQPSKRQIRKMTYHHYSHQTTPPELYLTKNSAIVEQWKSTGVPLVNLASHYGRVALYEEFFSEEENCYERSICFMSD